MKNINKINRLLLSIFLISMLGCESYLDVNNDPNASTKASSSGLLASAIYASSELNQSAGSVTSYYVQHLASPSGSAIDQHREVRLENTWFQVYNVLTDLDELITIASDQGSNDYTGIANILYAMNLGLATDLWGSIPYTEALQGGDNLTPAYDSQESIYSAIQQRLDTGIQDLQKGESEFLPGRDDYVYQGDRQKWIKTAYALKARYLNHSTKKTSYNPIAVLRAVDQSYVSYNEDAQMPYTEDKMNPWANVVVLNNGGLLGGDISTQLVEAMNGTSYPTFDPRLPIFADSLDDGSYAGTDNGIASPITGHSHINGDEFYGRRSTPLQLVTFAELKFIEAEASLRDNQGQRAYDAYLEGIRAHMDKIGVNQEDRDAYINDSSVSVGVPNLTIDHIMKEKNVAMFLHPEAWADARRYDYGYKNMELPNNHNEELNGQFIRRILYPATELTRNGANVPDATLGEALWFDQ
ncbi:MAG: SusD/RagB family nutrient-binding outer membrane lipoprotein [Gracilimonas sp.]|uniref:SusD/RagB family nutrient-binding outer membrane lipoprotein n=1 Tax=Gracilimonas sp. TaxID=1974203 RepID=UPI003751FD46|nr:SusD/RagB family nutrient-binding outer membrane lipoprotein [Gracilimonas sp.]